MPKGPNGETRSANLTQCAVQIGRISLSGRREMMVFLVMVVFLVGCSEKTAEPSNKAEIENCKATYRELWDFAFFDEDLREAVVDFCGYTVMDEEVDLQVCYQDLVERDERMCDTGHRSNGLPFDQRFCEDNCNQIPIEPSKVKQLRDMCYDTCKAAGEAWP